MKVMKVDMVLVMDVSMEMMEVDKVLIEEVSMEMEVDMVLIEKVSMLLRIVLKQVIYILRNGIKVNYFFSIVVIYVIFVIDRLLYRCFLVGV